MSKRNAPDLPLKVVEATITKSGLGTVRLSHQRELKEAPGVLRLTLMKNC
jgi:hypothetical protein